MTPSTFDPGPFLHQDEGQHFERKSMFEGPEGRKRARDRRAIRDHVAEVVSAFANAEGGILILGLEDDGTPTGHNLPADAVAAILTTPRSRLRPPQPEGFVVEHAGVQLLVFDVPISEVPVQVDGNGFPLRIGDSTVQSSESQIQTFKLHGLAESWESRPSTMALADLDPELLLRARRGAGREAWSDTEYLLARKLADRRGTRLILRRSAELLFATHGPDHPNAGVRVFRVIGSERRFGPEHNVEERPRIEGPLPRVIDEALTTIAGFLRRPSRMIGNRFREVPEYPEFSWKEAIFNAVAHRDYGVEGNCTEVWLFEDRMEVESPGGLVAEVSLDALVRGERLHRSRNPRLVRALVDLGAVRDQGEGIPRMFAEMEGLFLPEPTLTSDRRAFRVVLRNTPTLSIEDREWVSSLGSEDLSREEFRALLEAHRHGRVDNARLRDLTGLDTLTASRLLGRLRDRGLVVMRGGGAASYYTLVRREAGAADRNESGTDRRELAADGSNLGAERGESTPDRGERRPDRGELLADGGESERLRAGLPSAVAALVRHLGPRPRKERLRAAIVEVCRVRAWRPIELAAVLGLGRGDKLVARHLAPMVEAGILERTYPTTPNHPDQAYRVRGSSSLTPTTR